MFKSILCAIALVCSLPLGAQTLGTENQHSTVLILGDSLSAGYGMELEESWPALLEQRIGAGRVENASISGMTSSEGLQQVRKGLFQQHPANVLILELGANDALRGLSLSALKDNLEEIIRHAQEAQMRVLLLGMILPPNYGQRFNEAFSEVYQQLATEHELAIHPFFLEPLKGRRDYFLVDQKHPSAAAQPLLEREVWRELGKMIK